jgi:thiol-disulfide isomerase/thioredoxin
LRSHPVSLLAVAALLTFVAACESGKGPRADANVAAPSAPRPVSSHVRPEFVRGPTGGAPIAPFVKDELARGKATRHGVLVYVGATWCEPCQRFHQAVQAGELDETLDGVRLIEFDLDEDREILQSSGYSSRLIPLFALPNADGTGSARKIEGSVKGPNAVEQNLLPRLQAFLKGQIEG